MVACPVCQTLVSPKAMNRHLDKQCLPPHPVPEQQSDSILEVDVAEASVDPHTWLQLTVPLTLYAPGGTVPPSDLLELGEAVARTEVPTATVASDEGGEVVKSCISCGEEGHYSRYCPKVCINPSLMMRTYEWTGPIL